MTQRVCPLSDRKGKESAAMKADLLRARDMKRYINQLTIAKKQCEKRIRLLGGPNYEQSEEGAADETDGPQSQKVSLRPQVIQPLHFQHNHGSKVMEGWMHQMGSMYPFQTFHLHVSLKTPPWWCFRVVVVVN